MPFDEKYWSERYLQGKTQWDATTITTPLKAYFDQLTDKKSKILIPGCGNAHEAAYLHSLGFDQVHLIDLSDIPLKHFSEQHPDFPPQHLVQGDFFDHEGQYDIIIEQTFFCALDTSLRQSYFDKMHDLLNQGGRLVGVLFEGKLNEAEPPFGGERSEYLSYISNEKWHISVLERCYNSISPRAGRELFMRLVKK
jgi:methyl halide transferase